MSRSDKPLQSAVTRLDNAVPVAQDPANDVVVDHSTIVRWAGPLFLFCAVLLVPWTIWLAVTLPTRAQAEHYDLAWVGFDVMLVYVIGSTAVLTMRRSRYLSVSASVTAALLMTDAWFDVITSPSGADRLEAFIAAIVAELPLAALCFWLAVHTEDLNQRRMQILMRFSK